MSRFDEYRAQYPAIGFAVYAIMPGDPVTLETYVETPQGTAVYSWTGPTLEAALDMAFPEQPPAEPDQEATVEPTAPVSAFD